MTNQPDWATIIIKYKGNKINRESLLKYIISHRNENMFHENSVEGLFTKIYSSKNFEKLCVYARYTRRGGIDINPIRANYEIAVSEILNHRLARQ
ncbi:MAG: hypothetical protein SFT93_02495 [Rickettsiaceae bacterium]|nr:hypothetical protein [Rickettsiaceae bacterium]